MNEDAWIDGAVASPFFIEELYLKYEKDPSSIDPEWRKHFDALLAKKEEKILGDKDLNYSEIRAEQKGEALFHLINAYRVYGHLKAKTNPLFEELEDPLLFNIENYGFDKSDLEKNFPAMDVLGRDSAPLSEIIQACESIYCDRVGIEYMGLGNPEMEQWLQQRIEPNGFKIELSVDQKTSILDQLNKSELLEIFLHTKYTGQKRFSLEGGETLIPVLAAVIDKGSETYMTDFVIGMAHRGRLNVLANILNKSYSQIFTEFDANYIPESFEQSGDVKYHKGFFSETFSVHGHKVNITLTPNPSHLEAVDPVVEGQVYAKQFLLGDEDKESNKFKVLPLLIHGDAAISGQGVVYETLQLFNLKGYSTGGSLHFVVNNQIGFTTIPEDTRSTRYCTDIAKTFGAPVFHVNAEDPEGAIYASLLALELRNKFGCDVFVDIVCYRKYGHNETDEPAFTQPLNDKKIKSKNSIREIYRDFLITQGALEKQISLSLEAEFKESLQKELAAVLSSKKVQALPIQKKESENVFQHQQTGVSLKVLEDIASAISKIPEGFSLHPKLQRLVTDRLGMVKGEKESLKPIDWGMAEHLAMGSILWEGTSIRFSGQDCCRGTFSHRHAVWIDQQVEKSYYPLSHLKEKQGSFRIYNSSLSEYAVVGFEFGYSIANPSALTIWEAQFGDFGNGAQVIIDQFISTGEQKWGQQSGLVMLLPHGYEGQGPEHSSARIERFLTLCGQDNLQVVNPSTPAQYFHLLRRQIRMKKKKPLIVFSPKALLRHPQCVSLIEEFILGSFQEMLDDPTHPENVEVLIACSGHIYYDLIAEREKQQVSKMAIIRVEQLYPFYNERFLEILTKYPGTKKLCWVQEEPKNMGGGEYIENCIRPLLPEGVSLEVIARPRSASPAVGSYALHKKQHAELLEAVFGQKRLSIFEIAGKINK